MAEDSCSLIVHGVHGVDRMRSDRYGLPLVFSGFVYPFPLRIEGEGSVSFAIT